VTHIDPFAPGDSPQHPANWTSEPVALSVEDAIANTYQWRRDHFAMLTEADVDISAEELEDRHERYGEYLSEFGSGDEQREDTEFVPMPALLRRAVLADHAEDQRDEWESLFGQHATDDERDPMWVEGTLPYLAELRAREDVVRASAAPPTTEEPTADDLPPAPKATALKEEWVEYALTVAKARGEELTFEQADAMTVANLKAAYKPQAD
jgi:hypothetical protein